MSAGVGCVWQQLLFTACADGRLLMLCLSVVGIWGSMKEAIDGCAEAAAGQRDGKSDADNDALVCRLFAGC